MIRGSGAPQAQLYEGENQIGTTIILPRPNARLAQDYEPVYVTLGTNAWGEEVTELQGFRYHAVLLYFLNSQNRDSFLTTVCALGEWMGAPKRVKFRPHDDTSRWEQCEVISNRETPYEGTARAEEIRIELRGLNLYPKKPNLSDVRGRPRASVIEP
ncbi:hypothetical protein KKC97_02070 [bacterium]|nr:hypothetical protein [bacterium]MBU1636432.1 hypothetical protein [bacterium]